MTTQQIDQAKAEAFAGKMLGIIGGACLSLMSSLGHRSGLFNAMADGSPRTSSLLAKEAGLNERYVREWLGAMVTSEIVEYDAATKQYRLPPEHAAFTTTAAGPDNLAFFTQYIPLLGNVEDELLECFKGGGGVPYSSFPKFQAIQGEETRGIYDATLVGVTIPLVPGMVEKLQAGIEVADVGCGQGHAINVMAKAFPNSRFTGFDFSEEGVAAGRAEAQAMNLSNTTFHRQDAATLDQPGRFDFITAFDAIHDQGQPRKVLENIANAVNPDGTYLMVDIAASSNVEENIGNPWAPLFYTWSTMHCMTVSLAQGGEGLGTCWGEQQARQLLKDAGFNQVEVRSVEGDPINLYYICKK